MEQALPNIFEYIDFKKFLKDYRESKRATDPGFTNQYICHRLGQKNSKGYFNNVISGRKPVTSDFVDRFIDLLNLTNDEGKYFRALVNYNQTISPKEKEYHFDQVVALNCTPKKLIDLHAYTYFKDWYHASIRELLDATPFDGNFKGLAEKLDPSITAAQAKKSVELLKKLQLIKEDDKGVLRSQDRGLTTGLQVHNEVLSQYQTKAMDRAQQKIAQSPDTHQTGVITLAASKEGLQRVLKRLNQCKSELRSIAHKDEETDKKVYEVIVHIHSLSR